MNSIKTQKNTIYVLAFILVSFFGSIANAEQCVERWEDIRLLKPISGIKNIDQVIKNRGITFNIEGGKSFVLMERSGRIYAKTPMGNTDIKLCKLGNGQLIATADTIIGRKTVSVTPSRSGKFTIINSDKPSEALSATIQ